MHQLMIKKINDQIINGVIKSNKRIRIKKFDFMKEIVSVAERVYVRKSKNIKYTHQELLTCLIHFVSTHVSWRKYKGIDIPISGKYLNSVHLKYIEKGVYKAINEHLIEIYLKNNKCAKLKYQSIDSSFIPNKLGVNKASIKETDTQFKNRKLITKLNIKKLREYDNKKDMIVNNRYNGRERYIKISHLVDSNGVVLTNYIFSGKCSDFKSVHQTFDKLTVNLNTKKYENNNKYKQYFLADSGYDSKKIHNLVIKKGYTRDGIVFHTIPLSCTSKIIQTKFVLFCRILLL